MPSRRLLPVVPVLFSAILSPAAQAISFVEGGWISPELSQVSTVKTVDFNHDGRPDVVVKENDGTKVVWLENIGGGRFRQAGLWQSGSNGVICDGIEDFDGDGNLDLLIHSVTNFQDFSHLSIHYGVGPGKLDPAGVTRVLSGDGGTYATTTDVNGDGKPDILSDHLWLNQGGGNFTAVEGSDSIATQPAYLASHSGVFTWGGGSAAPDFFMVSQFGGPVLRHANLGGGKFATPVTVIAGDPRIRTSGLAIATLPEISDQPCLIRTIQSGLQQTLEVYVRSGEAFTLVAKLATGAYPDSKVQALRDGDHDRILLTTGRGSALAPAEVLATRKVNKVSLKLVTLEKPRAAHDEMALADVDGDGTADLVLAGAGMAWHPGVAGASFSKVRNEVSATDNGDIVCYAGDLDHDGAADLITQTPANALQSRITLWMNSGHGEFFRAVPLPVTADRVAFVAAGDYDQDGWPDLLVRTTKLGGRADLHSTNRLLLISRYPNGRIGQKTLITNQGPAWRSADLQQGNADGTLDFVTNINVVEDISPHYQIFPGKSATSFAAKPSIEGPLPLMKIFTDLHWTGTLEPVSRPDASRYTPPSLGGGTSIIINFPISATLPGSGIPTGDVWPTTLDFGGDGHTDFISKYNGYDVLMPARLGVTVPPSANYSMVVADYGNYARFPNSVVRYARTHGGSDYDAIYQTATDIRFRENLGGLNFAPEQVLSEPFVTGDGNILTADLDGDGVLDIIASSAADSSRLRWFKGVKN